MWSIPSVSATPVGSAQFVSLLAQRNDQHVAEYKRQRQVATSKRSPLKPPVESSPVSVSPLFDKSTHRDDGDFRDMADVDVGPEHTGKNAGDSDDLDGGYEAQSEKADSSASKEFMPSITRPDREAEALRFITSVVDGAYRRIPIACEADLARRSMVMLSLSTPFTHRHQVDGRLVASQLERDVIKASSRRLASNANGAIPIWASTAPAAPAAEPQKEVRVLLPGDKDDDDNESTDDVRKILELDGEVDSDGEPESDDDDNEGHAKAPKTATVRTDYKTTTVSGQFVRAFQYLNDLVPEYDPLEAQTSYDVKSAQSSSSSGNIGLVSNCIPHPVMRETASRPERDFLCALLSELHSRRYIRCIKNQQLPPEVHPFKHPDGGQKILSLADAITCYRLVALRFTLYRFERAMHTHMKIRDAARGCDLSYKDALERVHSYRQQQLDWHASLSGQERRVGAWAAECKRIKASNAQVGIENRTKEPPFPELVEPQKLRFDLVSRTGGDNETHMFEAFIATAPRRIANMSAYVSTQALTELLALPCRDALRRCVYQYVSSCVSLLQPRKTKRTALREARQRKLARRWSIHCASSMVWVGIDYEQFANANGITDATERIKIQDNVWRIQYPMAQIAAILKTLFTFHAYYEYEYSDIADPTSKRRGALRECLLRLKPPPRAWSEDELSLRLSGLGTLHGGAQKWLCEHIVKCAWFPVPTPATGVFSQDAQAQKSRTERENAFVRMCTALHTKITHACNTRSYQPSPTTIQAMVMELLLADPSSPVVRWLVAMPELFQRHDHMPPELSIRNANTAHARKIQFDSDALYLIMSRYDDGQMLKDDDPLKRKLQQSPVMHWHKASASIVAKVVRQVAEAPAVDDDDMQQQLASITSGIRSIPYAFTPRTKVIYYRLSALEAEKITEYRELELYAKSLALRQSISPPRPSEFGCRFIEFALSEAMATPSVHPPAILIGHIIVQTCVALLRIASRSAKASTTTTTMTTESNQKSKPASKKRKAAANNNNPGIPPLLHDFSHPLRIGLLPEFIWNQAMPCIFEVMQQRHAVANNAPWRDALGDVCKSLETPDVRLANFKVQCRGDGVTFDIIDAFEKQWFAGLGRSVRRRTATVADVKPTIGSSSTDDDIDWE